MVNISLEEMKNYLRMNGFDGFPTLEDDLLQDMINAAIEDVIDYVNQDFKDDEGNQEPIPTKLKTTAMKIVAIKYENRTGDTKELIYNTLNDLWQYRRWPGL